MNILFISSQPYPNGMAASKRIRLFAEYLAKNNNVKAFICGRSNEANLDEGKKAGVYWKYIKFTRFEYFLSIQKIYKLLKENYSKDKQNILLLYDGIGLTNFMFAIIGRILKYKIFTDIVEDYILHQEKTSFWLSVLHKINVLFDIKINRFVDGIIVISSRLFLKYKSRNFPEENICLIPISAENLKYRFKKELSSDFRFVYSGSYGKKDGVEDMITAIKKINLKYPNIQLILSGKINKLIESKIKMDEKIKYIGLVPEDQYYQFLSQANVLLMTRINSKYANTGFPFKLGEYLATGNPVIATDVSDVKTYLEDMRSALIAKPSDVSSLYSKMEYAILNKKETEVIGMNGREICEQYFSPQVNGDKLNSFIKSISNV